MSFRARSALILLFGGVIGITLSLGSGVLAERDARRNSLPWEDARLLAEVLERVKEEYIEPVDDSELIENAVRGMVTELDAHSQFLDSEQYDEIRISTTGNYSGVGLEVNVADDKVLIISPIDDTPAARAGLKSGDQIVSIDDITVDRHNVEDTIGRLRGKPGTKVMITVARASEPESIDFNLVRSHVRVNSVSAEILKAGFGYLRITHFSETTSEDLRKSIGDLKSAIDGELQGVVLDLRDNPGGVLEAAVAVSDAFLDGGLIVSANGRGQDATFQHEAQAGDLLDGIMLVLMVNGGSASASEIVAGALQDNNRATIVGSQTFGKGLVQTVMPLSKGRAIKLTTSRYYTPSGESIHGLGIMPDIVLQDAAQEDLLAGVAEHRTDAGAALLQKDKQLHQALRVLMGGRILQSKVE
ncbi:MAG: S41 family peptidase [Gammaproteobacteria bacterium]|jgi:carboxyl-terminal processing protease|nr:peptidase S41 [Chromatiales bacterium]MDP7419206.1 S41 family peptidase [Gammaproteobacteria bacterium]MDP7660358.1 S41 family peptidase [Gammaproteobacteria bacterium]HJP38199.1 S41 family peptidase [Gammaproteobacteria bacterium]